MPGIWMEVTLKLEPEEYALLRKKAQDHAQSVSEFARALIRRALKLGQTTPAQFLAAAKNWKSEA